MKVTVDEEKCCSAGTCVMLAPEVFDQSDTDGVVVLLESRPPDELRDAVGEAVTMCPAGAIALSEDG